MRGLYRDNLLVKKNAVIIHQQPVTISTISCPVYCLGLQEDNLTPAPAAFDTAKLFTNCQFILNDGTHVSGMLSTIKQTKLGYYHSELSNIPTLKEWKARAQYKKGSWWLNWQTWIQQQAPVMHPTPNHKYSLYSAPGEYIQKSFLEYPEN